MAAPRGDLVKYEGNLLIARRVAAQAFRARAVKRALQHLHDRRQLHDPRVGGLLAATKSALAAVSVVISEAMRLFSASIAARSSAKAWISGWASEALQLASSSPPSEQGRRQSSKLFSRLFQFAAGRQPTDAGRFTATGRTFVLSSPSISASNCAWFSRTPCSAQSSASRTLFPQGSWQIGTPRCRPTKPP